MDQHFNYKTCNKGLKADTVTVFGHVTADTSA